MAASFGVSLGFIIPPGKHTCLGWALKSGDLFVYNNPTPPSNSELEIKGMRTAADFEDWVVAADNDDFLEAN